MGALSPPYTGAWDTVFNEDVDETEDAVTTYPTHLGGWAIGNADATAVFVHFYDALIADVTVGTTAPKVTIGVAATSGDSFSIPGGIFFETAISVAATTTIGGNTGPGATEVSVAAFIG